MADEYKNFPENKITIKPLNKQKIKAIVLIVFLSLSMAGLLITIPIISSFETNYENVIIAEYDIPKAYYHYNLFRCKPEFFIKVVLNEKEFTPYIEYLTDQAIYSYYFNEAKRYKIKIYLSENIDDISYLFMNMDKLVSADLSQFNATNIYLTNHAFCSCKNLKNIKMFKDTSNNIINMQFMFYGTSLTSIDLTSLNTTPTNDMTYMFYKSGNLSYIDISTFDTSNAKIDGMFNEIALKGKLIYGDKVTKNVLDAVPSEWEKIKK